METVLMIKIAVTVAFAYGLTCGMLCYTLAEAKRLSLAGWFFVGFFFGVLGLIAAAGMPVEKK